MIPWSHAVEHVCCLNVGLMSCNEAYLWPDRWMLLPLKKKLPLARHRTSVKEGALASLEVGVLGAHSCPRKV